MHRLSSAVQRIRFAPPIPTNWFRNYHPICAKYRSLGPSCMKAYVWVSSLQIKFSEIKYDSTKKDRHKWGQIKTWTIWYVKHKRLARTIFTRNIVSKSMKFHVRYKNAWNLCCYETHYGIKVMCECDGWGWVILLNAYVRIGGMQGNGRINYLFTHWFISLNTLLTLFFVCFDVILNKLDTRDWWWWCSSPFA